MNEAEVSWFASKLPFQMLFACQAFLSLKAIESLRTKQLIYEVEFGFGFENLLDCARLQLISYQNILCLYLKYAQSAIYH